MRARVPHNIEGFRVFAREKPKRDIPFFWQQLIGSDNLPVNYSRQGGLGQAGANLCGNIDDANAMRKFQRFAVRQSDFEHKYPGKVIELMSRSRL
jgi:hypothetical protein